MSLCKQCPLSHECKAPCKKLRKELSKVENWKNKKEILLDPNVINNHLVLGDKGFYFNNE